MESSAQPERALASAGRLATLAPESGHLLHMPAHVYMRVGRYADASAANEASMVALVQRFGAPSASHQS